MTDKNGSGTPGTERRPGNQRRQVGGELIIPVAGIVFSLYYFSTILDSPWTAQVSAFFVGSVLIGLSAAFLIKTAIAWRAGEIGLAAGAIAAPRELLPRRLILLALTVGYIFAIHLLGFTITTFLFMLVAMAVLSGFQRLGFIVLLSATVSLAGWALFILAFDSRFPAGPFEIMMERLI